jgi:hypothetical protein
MEDLRFCNEFMSKQQHSQTPQKLDDSMQDDDFCLKYSGDEGIFKTAFYFIFLFFFWFHSIVLLFVQIYTDIIADDLPLVDVCRRLSAENRNRNLNSKNQPADPPE